MLYKNGQGSKDTTHNFPFVNINVKKHIHVLDDIERSTRMKYTNCQPFALYQFMIEVCRYWRQLESNHFDGLDKAGSDELYWHINNRIRELFTYKLDLYWLVAGYDGNPIYTDGREIDSFWCNRWTEHGIFS